MVYELRKYRTFDDFKNEEDSDLIVWETEESFNCEMPKICGKLCAYVSGEKTVTIPDGIETLGYSFLTAEYRGGEDSNVETVEVPASVQKIEEGAFANTYVKDIIIAPDSPCGMIQDNGLYTKDGKTLLRILNYNHIFGCIEDENLEYEYIVPDGVERIGIDFHDDDSFDTLIVPKSVTEIGYNPDTYFDVFMKIKAPTGSYAIAFAKEHNIHFEEL